MKILEQHLPESRHLFLFKITFMSLFILYQLTLVIKERFSFVKRLINLIGPSIEEKVPIVYITVSFGECYLIVLVMDSNFSSFMMHDKVGVLLVNGSAFIPQIYQIY